MSVGAAIGVGNGVGEAIGRSVGVAGGTWVGLVTLSNGGGRGAIVGADGGASTIVIDGVAALVSAACDNAVIAVGVGSDSAEIPALLHPVTTLAIRLIPSHVALQILSILFTAEDYTVTAQKWELVAMILNCTIGKKRQK